MFFLGSQFVYANLFQFDCETSNYHFVGKSLLNLFLEPTSTKQ